MPPFAQPPLGHGVFSGEYRPTQHSHMTESSAVPSYTQTLELDGTMDEPDTLAEHPSQQDSGPWTPFGAQEAPITNRLQYREPPPGVESLYSDAVLSEPPLPSFDSRYSQTISAQAASGPGVSSRLPDVQTLNIQPRPHPLSSGARRSRRRASTTSSVHICPLCGLICTQKSALTYVQHLMGNDR
jgi:hypothetical protein